MILLTPGLSSQPVPQERVHQMSYAEGLWISVEKVTVGVTNSAWLDIVGCYITLRVYSVISLNEVPLFFLTSELCSDISLALSSHSLNMAFQWRHKSLQVTPVDTVSSHFHTFDTGQAGHL